MSEVCIITIRIENLHEEKDDPTLEVVWYLPTMPRLKRLFVNPKDTKNLK